MLNLKYITRLEDISKFNCDESIQQYEAVINKYPFRTNDYYLSLIDWRDPNDPIRKIIVPDLRELDDWGVLDPSKEEEYTVVPGLQHKYTSTALLLVNNVCGGCCRFCFRKRIFMGKNNEIPYDPTAGIDYIKRHKEITNVLLTGGDPLLLSTQQLENIICALREIDHVSIIRIGSKISAFNPYRITNDPALLNMFARYRAPRKKIYLMAHYNHPRELTSESMKALDMLLDSGLILANQTPLLRGINDSSEILAELFNKLSFMGVPPYYVFQVRPATGNKMYCVPIEESAEIFNGLKKRCSGLAKRAKFVMSHATGKIEILGVSDGKIFLRYHRFSDSDCEYNIMSFKSNPEAFWFDDYKLPLD